jgi:hypothetical protein
VCYCSASVNGLRGKCCWVAEGQVEGREGVSIDGSGGKRATAEFVGFGAA